MKPSASEKRSEVRGSLYEEDFFAWTRRAAARLRAGRLTEGDRNQIAQEIDDMGRAEIRELNSRMQVLIAHLLKWKLQPENRSTSWASTIITQRIEIEALIEQSPSLRPKLGAELAKNYLRAVKRASVDTGLGATEFPTTPPFTLAEILNEDFLPES